LIVFISIYASWHKTSPVRGNRRLPKLRTAAARPWEVYSPVRANMKLPPRSPFPEAEQPQVPTVSNHDRKVVRNLYLSLYCNKKRFGVLRQLKSYRFRKRAIKGQEALILLTYDTNVAKYVIIPLTTVMLQVKIMFHSELAGDRKNSSNTTARKD